MKDFPNGLNNFRTPSRGQNARLVNPTRNNFKRSIYQNHSKSPILKTLATRLRELLRPLLRRFPHPPPPHRSQASGAPAAQVEERRRPLDLKQQRSQSRQSQQTALHGGARLEFLTTLGRLWDLTATQVVYA